MKIEQVWADAHERQLWYEGAAEYWDSVPTNNDGVLGGYSSIHDADISDSLRFIRCEHRIRTPHSATTGHFSGRALLPPRPPRTYVSRACRKLRGESSTPRPGTFALDVAAGVGRVSDALLLSICERVDLLEGSANLLEQVASSALLR
tara:strand:+ start:662 stop:1105 length:444 start_codon:yes stop_codon:yes gene_type:complete